MAAPTPESMVAGVKATVAQLLCGDTAKMRAAEASLSSMGPVPGALATETLPAATAVALARAAGAYCVHAANVAVASLLWLRVASQPVLQGLAWRCAP